MLLTFFFLKRTMISYFSLEENTMELNREQALSLLKKYNQEPFHIQHALTARM